MDSVCVVCVKAHFDSETKVGAEFVDGGVGEGFVNEEYFFCLVGAVDRYIFRNGVWCPKNA